VGPYSSASLSPSLSVTDYGPGAGLCYTGLYGLGNAPWHATHALWSPCVYVYTLATGCCMDNTSTPHLLYASVSCVYWRLLCSTLYPFTYSLFSFIATQLWLIQLLSIHSCMYVYGSVLLSRERLFSYVQKGTGFSLTLDLFVQLTAHIL
jgi:hypothetical protein